MKKKNTKPLVERVRNDESERLKIHLRVGYKDGIIVVRSVDGEVFLWDAIWHGDIYSGHFIITLPEGDKIGADGRYKSHPEAILKEVREMCYAGAATTIDMLRDEGKLDKKTQENVKIFEANRDRVEKIK